MVGHRDRAIGLRAGGLRRAAALDQEAKEQNDMHCKHGEEDVFKPPMTAMLKIILQGTGDQEWVVSFHDFLSEQIA